MSEKKQKKKSPEKRIQFVPLSKVYIYIYVIMFPEKYVKKSEEIYQAKKLLKLIRTSFLQSYM